MISREGETDVGQGWDTFTKEAQPCVEDTRSLGTVLPCGVIGLPNFTLSFILTFERILREDGLRETSLEVDYFSVLERERVISMNF